MHQLERRFRVKGGVFVRKRERCSDGRNSCVVESRLSLERLKGVVCGRWSGMHLAVQMEIWLRVSRVPYSSSAMDALSTVVFAGIGVRL